MHISGRDSKGNPPAWVVGARLLNHADAVDDGTDGDTEGAASAVRCDVGEVRPGVKGDGLVAGVIADHVALPAVYAHVLVNDGHHLLSVVQAAVGTDTWEGPAYHLLEGRRGSV